MSDDATIHRTEPVYTQRQNGRAVAVHANDGGEPQRRIRYASEYKLDGSDPETAEEVQLNGWLARNLEHEQNITCEAVAGHLAEREHRIIELERTAEKLERTVERLSGAIDVLRTGKVLRPCGLYNAERQYQQLDIVCLNGSSFVATTDRPGECPGPDWQLLASAGSRGRRGDRGPPGQRGEPGLSARQPTAGIRGLHINPATFVLSVFTGDRKLHQLNLRPLFQAFYNEVTRGG